MPTRIFVSIALILILFTSPAAADDPNDVGTAHSQAFAKACAAGGVSTTSTSKRAVQCIS